jgi:quercetin dioxygenase-like cupin family protein
MEVVSPDDRETEEPLEGSFLTQVVAGDRMSVQHFRSDPGGGAPEHSHEYEEIGYPVEGSLAITVDGEEYTVEAGEVYVIPAGEPHSLTNPGDEPAVGIMIFSPPRPRSPDFEE